LQECRAWLRIAAREIRLAELALGDKPPLPGEALYHAQQAAEKALKGFLVYSQTVYPLTHDVRKLLQVCEGIDQGLVATLAPAAGLT
jgi:HEPN domain-containing protein